MSDLDLYNQTHNIKWINPNNCGDPVARIEALLNPANETGLISVFV